MVDSRAGMQMVSKRDQNSPELETMRTSRSPTTVMAANGEGSSAKIMGILTTGPAVKNHISPKKAMELIAIHQTMYHS